MMLPAQISVGLSRRNRNTKMEREGASRVCSEATLAYGARSSGGLYVGFGVRLGRINPETSVSSNQLNYWLSKTEAQGSAMCNGINGSNIIITIKKEDKG